MNPLATSEHVPTEDLDPEFLLPRALYWIARIAGVGGLTHHQREEIEVGLMNIDIAVRRLETERKGTR